VAAAARSVLELRRLEEAELPEGSFLWRSVLRCHRHPMQEIEIPNLKFAFKIQILKNFWYHTLI
jgi:hypothetical protein